MVVGIKSSYYLGIWEFDLKTSKNYWSDTLFEMLYVSDKEAIPDFGEFIREFVHPKDADLVQNLDEEVFNSGVGYTIEIRIKTDDQRYKWFKLICQLDKESNGKISKVIRIFSQIDEIKKKELSKMDREHLLLETQKALNIGTWSVDLKNNKVIWSDEVYRIHEVPVGTEIKVEEAINYYREDFRGLIGNAVQEAIQLHTRLDIDAVLVTTSGREKWVQATFFPAKGEDNEVEFLHGLFMDIDERKRSEIHTEVQNETLELAADTGEIGIWEWNLKTNALHWNSQMLAQYETTEEDFKGGYSDFADRVHPDDLPDVEKRIQRALDGIDIFNTEFRLKFEDNSEKSILAKGIVIKNEIGENERFIGINIDITQQKEFEKLQQERAEELSNLNEILETEVQKRTEELTEAMVDLETLTYSISHDLRAPLRAIKGFIDIIKSEKEVGASSELLELLGYINDNAAKMDERIRSILDYHRVGSGELLLQKISLDNVFKEEFDRLLPAYPSLKIQFKTKDLPTIVADVGLIRQLVQNLLDNAIKYSSKEEKPQIDVICEENDSKYLINVSDNGAGFDMKYYDKLFHVFQRLHHESDFKGTGVGLSIAKRIVEKHDGTISAESEVGKGTTIHFTLPKSIT